MNINILILFILYLLICIYICIKLLLNDDVFFKKIINTMGFGVVALTIFHIFYSSYIYLSLKDSHGIPGPQGIEGKPGKEGKKGICNSECGQQSCYTIVLNNVNSFLKKEGIGSCDNMFLKNKINKLCFSDNYQGFLTSKLKKKPTEKDVIGYISDTVLKWIKIILSNKQQNGVQFLNNPDYDESYYDPNITPFNEIKKYEIWDWGEPYKIKPIIRRQCTDQEQLPKSDISDLDIIYTNNYEEPLFISKTRKNTYGPIDCPYNQLGSDFSNPRDITKCYTYDSNNSVISTQDVWLREEYIGFKRDISFYNVKKRIVKGKTYYPVGTVWRATSNKYRSELNKTAYGPHKKTILVAGKISFPIDFKKIWSSSDCEKCVPDKYTITVWRPIAPKGYVCLGDFVSRGTEPPEKEAIACISESCVSELPLKKNSDVWNTDGFMKRIKKKSNSKGNIVSYKGSNVSIWPIGITEKEEEILNLSYKKINPLRIGGYNLFRANNSFLKPTTKSSMGWEIKSKCYTIMPTQDPDIPNNDMGTGWLGGKQRDTMFSVFPFLKYTINGILDAYPVKSNESFYIEHVEGNFYSLKGADKNTGLFNSYLRENHTSINRIKDTNYDRSVNQLQWEIDIQEKITENDNTYPIIKLKSKSNNKCILQNTSPDGTLDYSLVNCDTDGTLWKFTPSTGF